MASSSLKLISGNAAGREQTFSYKRKARITMFVCLALLAVVPEVLGGGRRPPPPVTVYYPPSPPCISCYIPAPYYEPTTEPPIPYYEVYYEPPPYYPPYNPPPYNPPYYPPDGGDGVYRRSDEFDLSNTPVNSVAPPVIVINNIFSIM